ncbi:hypothetical protein ACH5RR_008378 [Cinchona calisaya]|uniref:Uncharacterized protein n=1 Tax=Cinchona calisaya TaxID=153742 RepID=A0ABD3ABB9_9GENT
MLKVVELQIKTSMQNKSWQLKGILNHDGVVKTLVARDSSGLTVVEKLNILVLRTKNSNAVKKYSIANMEQSSNEDQISGSSLGIQNVVVIDIEPLKMAPNLIL